MALHEKAGKELVLDECPAIIDGIGEPRKLGAIPSPGLKSAFPLLEDAVPIMSDDEIRNLLKSGKRPKSGRHQFGSDWIKDQSSYGSCAGWASASALERARVRKRLPWVKLSGSSVYAQVNGGRDNGSIPEEAMVAMQNRGAVPIGPSRVDEIYMSNYSASDWAEAARYKAGECYATRDLQAFFTGIALGFDGVVAVHAGSRFMRMDGNGVAGVDNGGGNHAVCVDDIDMLSDGTLVLDDPNSWGLSFGVNGRAYLTKKHFAQTIQNFAFYLVRTANDDPQGSNPPSISE